jgi:hypothetical protein
MNIRNEHILLLLTLTFKAFQGTNALRPNQLMCMPDPEDDGESLDFPESTAKHHILYRYTRSQLIIAWSPNASASRAPYSTRALRL